MATVMRTGQVMGHVWPTVENKKNSLMTEESGRRAQDIDVKPKHRRDIFRFLLTLVRVVWADLMERIRRLRQSERPLQPEYGVWEKFASGFQQGAIERIHLLALQQQTDTTTTSNDTPSTLPSLVADDSSHQDLVVQDNEIEKREQTALSPPALRPLQDSRDRPAKISLDQDPPFSESSSLLETGHLLHGKNFKTIFTMVIHMPNGPNGEIVQRVAKLDTGAQSNVIRRQIVTDLGLVTRRYFGPKLEPVGPAIEPEGEVSFDWHVSGKQATYNTGFAVLNDALCNGFEILLGEPEIGRIGFYNVDSKIFFLQ